MEHERILQRLRLLDAAVGGVPIVGTILWAIVDIHMQSCQMAQVRALFSSSPSQNGERSDMQSLHTNIPEWKAFNESVVLSLEDVVQQAQRATPSELSSRNVHITALLRLVLTPTLFYSITEMSAGLPWTSKERRSAMPIQAR
jgi:hypothetical protein